MRIAPELNQLNNVNSNINVNADVTDDHGNTYQDQTCIVKRVDHHSISPNHIREFSFKFLQFQLQGFVEGRDEKLVVTQEVSNAWLDNRDRYYAKHALIRNLH